MAAPSGPCSRAPTCRSYRGRRRPRPRDHPPLLPSLPCSLDARGSPQPSALSFCEQDLPGARRGVTEAEREEQPTPVVLEFLQPRLHRHPTPQALRTRLHRLRHPQSLLVSSRSPPSSPARPHIYAGRDEDNEGVLLHLVRAFVARPRHCASYDRLWARFGPPTFFSCLFFSHKSFFDTLV